MQNPSYPQVTTLHTIAAYVTLSPLSGKYKIYYTTYKNQKMKLQYVIKKLREDKEMTQEKLAEYSGLTRGYISRLEQGEYPDESPSIKTLRKIADGLKEPLELLLSLAGITKEDYMKMASTPTFLRAKYNFNEEQSKMVENYIQYIKKELKTKQ
jgi:transcriptional regulator with XRE-family HTH domain